jgi:mycothiol synthase
MPDQIDFQLWTPEQTGAFIALRQALCQDAGERPADETAWRQEARHPGFRPEERMWLATRGGRTIGFALTWVEEYETVMRATLEIGVERQGRGGGLGGALLYRVVDRLPPSCRYVDCAVTPNAQSLAKFLATYGFRPDFRSYRLVSHAAAHPLSPPVGWKLAPLPRAQAERFRQLHNNVFSGTPRWRPITREALDYYFSTSYFDPQGIRILEHAESGDWSGFFWADAAADEWEESGRKRGCLESFGVVPALRSEGLGRFILLAGIEWLASQGCQEVELSVDERNELALELYRSQGFEVESARQWFTTSLRSLKASFRQPEDEPVVT